MNDLKGRQVFTEDEKTSDIDCDVTSQTLFEPQETFVPITSSEAHEDEDEALERVIKGNSKKGWIATSLLVAFAGLVGWQAVDNVITAASTGDWLSLGWSGLVTAIATLGIGALGKELYKLRKLKDHFSVQEQAEQLIDSDGVGQGEKFCQRLAEEAGIQPEHPSYDRWKNSVHSAHSDAEVLNMYQSMVITEQDKKALSTVSTLSGEAALLVALSPLAIADMLLIAWRNFKMIDKLSEVYGVELGYWSRLRLFKLVLVNIAVAGATELAIESSADILSLNLAEKLSARAGQGLGVGLITARLGLKTISLMRPIPFPAQEQPKLSSIRQSVMASLRNKLS
ncbi:YcjF family protein [Vibrio methylphosphonaticus]|uniref:YcjF family protein n=1 Tax=Vibrio methylphosphonaticus TaxID=2946866 RepID=UPI00202A49B7|nr:TIGR01620 family protein [Vibrio methylphosphonaticus]MCL9775814.1 YcjF family protein [Vibrio methylphosphonaticus]